MLYPPLYTGYSTQERVEHRELGPSSISWLPAQLLQSPMDLMGSCWLQAQVVPLPWLSDPPYMTLDPVSSGDGQALDTTMLPGFEGPTNALKTHSQTFTSLLHS